MPHTTLRSVSVPRTTHSWQRESAVLTFGGKASVGKTHYRKTTRLQHSMHFFEDFLHTNRATDFNSNGYDRMSKATVTEMFYMEAWQGTAMKHVHALEPTVILHHSRQ